MSTSGRRSAAHKALLIVAPLVLLTYAGVGGWLYLSGPPQMSDTNDSQTSVADESEKQPATGDSGTQEDSHDDDDSQNHGDHTEDKSSEDHGSDDGSDDGHDKPASDHDEKALADDHKAADTPAHTDTKQNLPATTHTEPAADQPGTKDDDGRKQPPAMPGQNTKPEQARASTPPKISPLNTSDGVTMAPAPDPELTIEGTHGPLPQRAVSGRVPWQVYARPFRRERGDRLIAIVITELGLAEPPTVAAIQDLPGEISLAFSPYSRRLAEWVPGARAAGHEVLLQIPMEPRNLALDDPGDRALLTVNNPATNLDNLDWVLSRAVGYVGVTSFMGSKLTASDPAMRPIMDVLQQRGLAYVDARVTPLSVAGKVAFEQGVPTAVNDRFIDPQAARAPIDARLAELEQVALSQGSAIGYAQAYPVTIERLKNWIPGMKRRGFRLAPITAIIRPGGN